MNAHELISGDNSAVEFAPSSRQCSLWSCPFLQPAEGRRVNFGQLSRTFIIANRLGPCLEPQMRGIACEP
jgi:hypothetical protein